MGGAAAASADGGRSPFAAALTDKAHALAGHDAQRRVGEQVTVASADAHVLDNQRRARTARGRMDIAHVSARACRPR